MKVLHQNKLHKKALVIIIVVALLVLLLGWYLLIHKGSVFGWHVFPNSTVSTSAKSSNNALTTKEQQQAGQTIKSNSLKSGTSGSDQPSSPTPIPNSSNKNVVLSITNLTQNGTDLRVGILIQALVDTGTCTITLTSPGETTVTQSSGVDATSNTSTCDGFDIQDLTPGTWQITVTYNGTNLTGTVTQSKVIQ